jgi:hypothetical protein
MSPPDDQFPNVVSLREWAQRSRQSTATEPPKSTKSPFGNGPTDPPKSPPRTATILGDEVETNNPVEIGDRERRSGLYVLGKPRMGKSTLFVNMIAQDMEGGRSVFFLDPHGQAITDLFERYPHVKFALDKQCLYLLDPTDNDYSFGLNPLYCPDITRLTNRQRTYDKAFSVFKRIWEKESQWGVWLERILQSLLPIFIELQEYTLAEMPLFLNDSAFRAHVLEKVKYNIDLLDYWQYKYEEIQAQSARNRVGSLLSDPRVRHIIGQLKPTINFEQIVKSTTNKEKPQFVFLRLPANLSDIAKHFIGTIIVTELFYAIETRKGPETADTFCLYVDEFQHFATSQLARFIRESGKWGCTIALAHQDRRGQFRENEDILGATLTCANRVVFQVNESDARELAVGFAEEPIFTETRQIPELVLSKEPVWDLVSRGHPNKRVQWLVDKHLRPIYEYVWQCKEEIEEYGGLRLLSMDEAIVNRDQASIYGAQDRSSPNRVFGEPVTSNALARMEAALQRTLASHSDADSNTRIMLSFQKDLQITHGKMRDLNEFLSDLMDGRISLSPGQEILWKFFDNVYINFDFEKGGLRGNEADVPDSACMRLCKFYWQLQFGDPSLPRVIPDVLALIFLGGVKRIIPARPN